jgi:hypothetical protein
MAVAPPSTSANLPDEATTTAMKVKKRKRAGADNSNTANSNTVAPGVMSKKAKQKAHAEPTRRSKRGAQDENETEDA